MPDPSGSAAIADYAFTGLFHSRIDKFGQIIPTAFLENNPAV
jgi:hypothetical protein